MRIASRAMTCFIRTLLDELPAPILRLSIGDLGDWIHNLPWAKLLGEADCKEQFNKIHPRSIILCRDEASQWLTKQRRWRADDLIWSIHRECPKLDRAGQASAKSFKHITHTFLTSIVKWDLLVQNSAFAVGQVWSHTGCIPMGGYFSAQAADLYSFWRLKKLVRVMRALGDLSTSEVGIPIWTAQIHGASVRIALAQFRDNAGIPIYPCHGKSRTSTEIQILANHGKSRKITATDGNSLGKSRKRLG